MSERITADDFDRALNRAIDRLPELNIKIDDIRSALVHAQVWVPGDQIPSLMKALDYVACMPLDEGSIEALRIAAMALQQQYDDRRN